MIREGSPESAIVPEPAICICRLPRCLIARALAVISSFSIAAHCALLSTPCGSRIPHTFTFGLLFSVPTCLHPKLLGVVRGPPVRRPGMHLLMLLLRGQFPHAILATVCILRRQFPIVYPVGPPVISSFRLLFQSRFWWHRILATTDRKPPSV